MLWSVRDGCRRVRGVTRRSNWQAGFVAPRTHGDWFSQNEAGRESKPRVCPNVGRLNKQGCREVIWRLPATLGFDGHAFLKIKFIERLHPEVLNCAGRWVGTRCVGGLGVLAKSRRRSVGRPRRPHETRSAGQAGKSCCGYASKAHGLAERIRHKPLVQLNLSGYSLSMMMGQAVH